MILQLAIAHRKRWKGTDATRQASISLIPFAGKQAARSDADWHLIAMAAPIPALAVNPPDPA